MSPSLFKIVYLSLTEVKSPQLHSSRHSHDDETEKQSFHVKQSIQEKRSDPSKQGQQKRRSLARCEGIEKDVAAESHKQANWVSGHSSNKDKIERSHGYTSGQQDAGNLVVGPTCRLTPQAYMISISWRETNGLWTGKVVQFRCSDDQTGLGLCEFDTKLVQFGVEIGQVRVGLVRHFLSLLLGQMGREPSPAINISFVKWEEKQSRETVMKRG